MYEGVVPENLTKPVPFKALCLLLKVAQSVELSAPFVELLANPKDKTCVDKLSPFAVPKVTSLCVGMVQLLFVVKSNVVPFILNVLVVGTGVYPKAFDIDLFSNLFVDVFQKRPSLFVKEEEFTSCKSTTLGITCGLTISIP